MPLFWKSQPQDTKPARSRLASTLLLLVSLCFLPQAVSGFQNDAASDASTSRGDKVPSESKKSADSGKKDDKNSTGSASDDPAITTEDIESRSKLVEQSDQLSKEVKAQALKLYAEAATAMEEYEKARASLAR